MHTEALNVEFQGSPDIALVSSPVGKVNLINSNPETSDTAAQVRQRKIEQRESSKNLATDLKARIVKTYKMLEDDKDFREMRKPFTKQFFDAWNIGFNSYIGGDWKKAKTQFDMTMVDPAYPDHAARNY